jgi:hypothetical protein
VNWSIGAAAQARQHAEQGSEFDQGFARGVSFSVCAERHDAIIDCERDMRGLEEVRAKEAIGVFKSYGRSGATSVWTCPNGCKRIVSY